MTVMEKLRMFVAQEPVVAASCLIAGIVDYPIPLTQKEEFDEVVPIKLELEDGVLLIGSTAVAVVAVAAFLFGKTISFLDESKKDDIGLIAGLFLPAVVRPIFDSLETAKPVPPPQLSDVVAGITGKKRD